MRILGISCHYHDSAAALLQDGDLVAASHEERFSRKKHDAGFPAQAIDFCLQTAGITARDVDYIAFYEKPFVKAERLMTSILATFPRSRKLFQEGIHVWLKDKLWVKEYMRKSLGIDPSRILFVEHHKSHAASALFSSPFKEAALLTIDGVGEWTTATWGRGSADWGGGTNRIDLSAELRFPHSLGLLYSVFTAYLGFEVNEGEYKVMGMAPFGTPRYVDEIKKTVEIREDGSLWLDPAYISFPYHTEQSFTSKLEDLLGPARNPKARFVTSQTSRYDDPIPPTDEELRLNQHYADVAASIQKVTEEVMIAMARHAHRQTGLSKLCIAGGVGLNCVANYKVLRETPFEEIYVQPAAGDAGGALGAALYAYHVLLGKPRRFVMKHCNWGKTYPDSLIAETLAQQGVRHEVFDSEDRLLDRVVDSLVAGKVIGWYHGRFEWGPRALGSRSIIADPRGETMKDVVNIKIKFREPFRPFAPSVLAEQTSRLFDLPDAEKHYPTRFMLYVAPVLNGNLPAITHVDGSSRPQAVHSDVSPRYYRLIDKFSAASGVPMVLNTSFNLKGEPIVGTPADALSTFSRSGMDVLVMENFVVTKEK